MDREVLDQVCDLKERRRAIVARSGHDVHVGHALTSS